jgi:hypothetical protein
MSFNPGESLRHQYLEAIGISSWLPRADLPGAAPSADWVAGFRYPDAGVDDWTDEYAGTETDPVSTASRGADRARASVQRLLDEPKPNSAPEPRTQRASQAPAEPHPVSELAPAPLAVKSGERQPAPRIKLAFVLARDLLVIDSLPPASNAGFGAQQQRLLRGVLMALGIKDQPSEAALLSWPALAGASLDQGPDELKKALARKLEVTEQVRPFNAVLLLGEAAAQWVLEREESIGALRGLRFTLSGGKPCVVGCSLSEALKVPDMKAGLWLDVQPLLKALADQGLAGE